MLFIVSSVYVIEMFVFLFIIDNAGILSLNFDSVDNLVCQYFLLQPIDFDKVNGGLLLPIIKWLFWL